MIELTRPQARRIALGAQGFLDRPHDQPTMRTLNRTLERTGVLQVDSVNVLQRAHFMPLYSRMGAYDVDLLARASRRKPRRLVEYWAHVQALMPVELWPVMQHRMASYRTQKHKWWGTEVSEDLVAGLIAEIADRGACTARDLDDGLPRDKKHWGWNWSATKRALDYLYMVGDVAIAGRNGQFEVRYDLRSGSCRRTSWPPRADARGGQPRADPESGCEVARGGHGALSVRLLPDAAPARRRQSRSRSIEDLVEEGELVPVRSTAGTGRRTCTATPRCPRRVDARALLSPFDPVVWLRERTEKLFDFHYRIEIYTPAAKRSTATTCCRSCWATRSSPGSTSRPTGSRAGSS